MSPTAAGGGGINTPYSGGNTGQVTTPYSGGNTGGVTTPYSTTGLGTINTPYSQSNAPLNGVSTPYSQGNNSTPYSLGNNATPYSNGGSNITAYSTYSSLAPSLSNSTPYTASGLSSATSTVTSTVAPIYERMVSSNGNKNINEECGIREVWAGNMEEEFKQICHTVQKFPFVAMDTEFPGVVARPIGDFKSTADYQYQLLRCNVDLLKIIQLGLTFLDEKGNMPEGITTWQFNFKFNLTEDMYAEDSVDLLQNSGIRFEKHERDGIETTHFAEILLVSGVVLMDNVRFLSFHSGYDFGYLLKLLTNQNLPQEESEFFELLKLYFPNVYDVKYLMKSCKNLKGGLQEVADLLEVERIGPQHQAGSDSLLTGATFFKMTEMFFEDAIDDSKYCGHLFGLGTNYVVTSSSNDKTTTTMTTTQTSTESTDDDK